MSLRDTLRQRVQPMLEPGEQIQEVFLAQTGPSPYWIFVTYLFFFWTHYYAVAVTDREIAVFRSSVWRPARPRTWHKRVSRTTVLGAPLKGLWGTITLDGERFFVHKRFHADVARADAALAPSAWAPTHTVPARGLSAWAAPDPSAPPVTSLGAGLPVRVVERSGAWARVSCDNGWTGWVDGRALPG